MEGAMVNRLPDIDWDHARSEWKRKTEEINQLIARLENWAMRLSRDGNTDEARDMRMAIALIRQLQGARTTISARTVLGRDDAPDPKPPGKPPLRVV
jgi:hypothetical protein